MQSGPRGLIATQMQWQAWLSRLAPQYEYLQYCITGDAKDTELAFRQIRCVREVLEVQGQCCSHV